MGFITVLVACGLCYNQGDVIITDHHSSKECSSEHCDVSGPDIRTTQTKSWAGTRVVRVKDKDQHASKSVEQSARMATPQVPEVQVRKRNDDTISFIESVIEQVHFLNEIWIFIRFCAMTALVVSFQKRLGSKYQAPYIAPIISLVILLPVFCSHAFEQFADILVASSVFVLLVFETFYRGKPTEDDSPLVTYTSRIASCSKVGDVKKAEYFLHKMRSEGLVPNVKHFNSLLDTCAKAGNVDVASTWIRRMSLFHVKPNVISYTAMINACAKQRDVDKAEYWINEMIRSGCKPDVVSYTTVIDTCAKSGKASHAEHWVRQMTKDGVEPNVVSYNILIDAYAKEGNIDRALSWLDHMASHKVTPNIISYNAVIDACAKAGNSEMAEYCIERMDYAGVQPDIISYNAVIDACSKVPNIDRAVHWLKKLQNEPDITPDVISYTAVINACAQSGRFEIALEWLEQMEKSGVRPNIFSYNATINAQVKAGVPLEPMDWIHRLRKVNIVPNVVTYTTLCQPYAKKGEYKTVENLMKMIESDGLQPNHYCLAVRLNAFSNACPKRPDLVKQVFERAAQLRQPINDTALRNLTRCLGRAKAMELCKDLGLAWDDIMQKGPPRKFKK